MSDWRDGTVTFVGEYGVMEGKPLTGDFNGDGKVNVRDAAAIAKFLATGKKEA